MRSINHHPQWQHQPLRLTETEKKDIPAVLNDFFTNYHLQDIRELLWDWLVVALSSDKIEYGNGIQRNNLIYLYEKLETLVEASWMIHCRHQHSQKRYHPKKQRSPH